MVNANYLTLISVDSQPPIFGWYYIYVYDVCGPFRECRLFMRVTPQCTWCEIHIHL